MYLGCNNYDEFDKLLLRSVVYYTSTKFLGRGVYQNIRHETFEDAEQHAKNNKGRWGIYAVCMHLNVEHTVHLGNIFTE
jgi:hypothetical protein